MDMQNVSNLQIPEGVVRTIHDKDNRLIWGRVNYDTKYAGNTVQDGTPTPDAPVPVQIVTGEQTVTVSGTNLCNFGTDTFTRLKYYALPKPLEAGTYTFSAIVQSDDTTYSTCLIRFMSSQSGSDVGLNRYIARSTGRTSVTVTTTATMGGIYLYSSTGASAAIGISATFTDMQLEKGSTATPFQPYQSQSYTVNLGSTELCKIGNYQDYIYKSGSDWYVHKEFATRTIDENTTYTSIIFGSTNTIRISYSGTSPKAQPEADGVGISPYLQWKLMWSKDEQGFYANGITFVLRLNKSIVGTTEQSFLTWLASNPLSFYYAIETPTNTKITDTTLISQLEAIDEWMTRYGYNATVTGNLPIIVDRSNL